MAKRNNRNNGARNSGASAKPEASAGADPQGAKPEGEAGDPAPFTLPDSDIFGALLRAPRWVDGRRSWARNAPPEGVGVAVDPEAMVLRIRRDMSAPEKGTAPTAPPLPPASAEKSAVRALPDAYLTGGDTVGIDIPLSALGIADKAGAEALRDGALVALICGILDGARIGGADLAALERARAEAEAEKQRKAVETLPQALASAFSALVKGAKTPAFQSRAGYFLDLGEGIQAVRWAEALGRFGAGDRIGADLIALGEKARDSLGAKNPVRAGVEKTLAALAEAKSAKPEAGADPEAGDPAGADGASDPEASADDPSASGAEASAEASA